jgi:DNA repair ATPase RecN
LTYIYLEMPHFNKTEEELETTYDKWLYVLKCLPKLQDRPEKLQERVFQKLFEAAEIAKFTPEEKEQYEDSLKVYRDLKNVIDTAFDEGKIEEKTANIIKALQRGKLSVEEIAEDFETTVEFVLKIKTDNNI